jgi:hypothetical protein
VLGNTLGGGLETSVHPLGNAAIDPWIGLGAGIEWLNTTTTNAETTYSLQYRALVGTVKLGVDFALTPAFRVGPYASFSLGSYFDVGGESFQDTATHEWLSFGAGVVVLL